MIRIKKSVATCEAQKENILMAFSAEPEYDQYGIANAVTLAAQKEETWEKSVELERIGGNLISLLIEEFKSLELFLMD